MKNKQSSSKVKGFQKIKAMYWRCYYYLFTDNFSEFDSLKELLSIPYDSTYADQLWERRVK